MRLRGLAASVAFMALSVAAAPAWAPLRATLIDVHGIKMAGKPGPATANCSPDQPANGGFELTGWQVGGDKTAYLTTSSVPSSLGSVTSTLQAAFDAWLEPGVPKITVAGGGTVTRATANHRYELMWGRAGGSTLAVTYTWRWSDGTIESDTVFNKAVSWALLPNDPDGCDLSKPFYDVGNIAAHEFGHTYGLGHPAGDRFETMYAYGYSGETLKRSPANGDLAGINQNY